MYSVLALTDMRPQFFGASIALVLGLVVLRLARKPGSTTSRFPWLAIIALFASPVLAVGGVAVAMSVFTPEFHQWPGDYLAMIPPVLLIGTLVGVIAAVALGIESRMRR